ncbi:MAG: hypothetical protein ABIU86_02335 [Gemmatimonadaceae bacterium]
MLDVKAFLTRNIRRLTAVLVVTSVLGGPVEFLIPDAHDGDAFAAEQTETGHPQSRDGDTDRPANPNHTVHVDHCAHGHLISNVESAPKLVRADIVAAAFGRTTTRLTGVILPPLVPPPIA